MAEKDPHVESKSSGRGIIRQPPRVPFSWEEQPGIAKKEWKMDSPQPFIIKSIDSVWDDIPQTQLVPFSPKIHHSYVNLMDSPLPLPPALISVCGEEKTAYYDRELSSRSNDDDNDVKHVANFGQENPCPKTDIEEPINKTPVARVPSRPFKLVGSVPFMWEAKPGTPLSSFSWDMPETHLVMRVPSRPVKFVASVPFSWEEKPGKPLPSCQFFGTDQTTSNKREGHGNNNSSQYMFDFDVESFSFDTNESSEPSLVENCLLPSASISNVVHVQTNPFLSMDEDDNYPQPDTYSDTESSYETEVASFVGSSLLEWLFPNFPPKLELLEKNESCNIVPEKVNPPEKLEAGPTDFGYSVNGSFAIRKPKTLGELIMMSRRRSYVRKAAQVRKQNPSMHEFVKKGTFGCWTFGQGLNLKRQLRLKMV